jgi:hypothetical protein
MIKRDKRWRLAFLRWWRRFRVVVRKMATKIRRHLPGEPSTADSPTKVMRDIQARVALHIIERLKEIMPESDVQSEKISQLIREYERTVQLIKGPSPSVTAIARQIEPDLDVVRMALRIELEKIQEAYEEGSLSRSAAQQMRKNVYLMQIDFEDYV